MKKQNKILIGIGFGIIAGLIDVISMILQKLTLDANLSAFAHWVIAGFIISISHLKLKGALKGLVLSLLLPPHLCIGVGVYLFLLEFL